MSSTRLAAAAACVLAGSLLGQEQPASKAGTPPADAATFGNQKAPKKEKAPTSRVVTGQVTDETGSVLDGALVTLTDLTSKEKTTFFTKKDGRYRFEELSFNKDYSVQAKYKTFSSEPRKISEFDRSPKPVRILEVNTETKPAPGVTAAAGAPPQ